MPTYVYRREDGSTFEIQQRITEPTLKSCPTTGQPVTRLSAMERARHIGLVPQGETLVRPHLQRQRLLPDRLRP